MLQVSALRTANGRTTRGEKARGWCGAKLICRAVLCYNSGKVFMTGRLTTEKCNPIQSTNSFQKQNGTDLPGVPGRIALNLLLKYSRRGWLLLVKMPSLQPQRKKSETRKWVMGIRINLYSCSLMCSLKGLFSRVHDRDVVLIAGNQYSACCKVQFWWAAISIWIHHIYRPTLAIFIRWIKVSMGQSVINPSSPGPCHLLISHRFTNTASATSCKMHRCLSKYPSANTSPPLALTHCPCSLNLRPLRPFYSLQSSSPPWCIPFIYTLPAYQLFQFFLFWIVGRRNTTTKKLRGVCHCLSIHHLTRVCHFRCIYQ